MKVFIFLFLTVSSVFAADIVTDSQNPLTCQEFRLQQEIRVYKDPSLFLPQLSQIYADPASGWDALMKESPLVTTLKGTVQMWLGAEREFKNFGEIARLYELVDPRFKTDKKTPGREKSPLIQPIKICSADSYNDTMGFVLSSDLKRGQTDPGDLPTLPPSGHPNPIPKLRKAPYWE